MARIGGNPGNKGGGRKKLKDEIAVIKYYEAMLPKVFKLVREKLETGTKKDKEWAADWVKTGIVKMIPQIQKIGGDKDNKTSIAITGINYIIPNGDYASTNSETTSSV